MNSRIASLRRRDWTCCDDTAVEELSAAFNPSGRGRLRLIQAMALRESFQLGGVFLGARVGAGKAQPVDEPVLTPSGWRPIGELRSGEFVIGASGAPTEVLGVFPQGARDVARVTFSDGSWTRCDWEHLWTARDAHGQIRTRSLAAWAEYGLSRKCGEHRAAKVFIPLVDAVQAPAADLPVDPYTLGALLGDGGLTQATISFTTADPDVLHAMVLPAGVTAKPCLHQNSGKATQYNLTTAPGAGNGLRQAIDKLGLRGARSSTKFVPPEYLRASAEQRAALLAGLLDTDGATAAPGGWIEFSTLSPRLSAGVCALVQSLGGTYRVNTPAKNGNVRAGIKMPFNPFRCVRKAQGWSNGQRGPLRAMQSIENDGREECICIAVAAKDRLYVTRDHIVTHNTLAAGLLATAYQDERPLIIVPGGHLEKTEHELAAYRAQGWELSHKLQIVTYQDIARDVDEKLFRAYEPGRLICDEADKLRRVQRGGSGTAARVNDYIFARPATRMDAMTGTFFKEGLKDYGHIMNWCLRDAAPVPRSPADLAAWHKALKGEGSDRRIREALGISAAADLKKAFRERLWYSPGVIISVDAFTGVALTFSKVGLEKPRELDALYADGVTPDGFDVVDAGSDDAEAVGSTWAAERQIALGFYYKADPAPPREWAKKRRAYFRWVRQAIQAGRAKTELQARRLAIREGAREWAEWAQIQPTFEPRFTPVWLNDRALEYCKQWGRDGGVIWTDHRAFADRLSAETGWRWFAGGGLDSTGLMIEKCTDRTVIASRQANGTGRNLQRWSRGLVTALPSNGRDAEQLFGRQHREGQERDVQIDILFGCKAHHADLEKVFRLSHDEAEEMGRTNKILSARWH